MGQGDCVNGGSTGLGEGVDQVKSPGISRILRMFQPEDQARPVLSAYVVDPPVAIDVQSSTLDDANTGPQQRRLPTGRAEERNLALVLDVSADHVQASRAREF